MTFPGKCRKGMYPQARTHPTGFPLLPAMFFKAAPIPPTSGLAWRLRQTCNSSICNHLKELLVKVAHATTFSLKVRRFLVYFSAAVSIRRLFYGLPQSQF
jgi:hypothetical protein